MRGRREVKQHRSWVSSGDRSGPGDPSVAVPGDPSVAVPEPSRDTGLSLQRKVELWGSPGCSCTAAWLHAPSGCWCGERDGTPLAAAL